MIPVRKFQIATYKNHDGSINRYTVTDATNSNELDLRPNVAEFPVSVMYDATSQRGRARLLTDYMNRIAEATEIAYQQNLLLDTLKA